MESRVPNPRRLTSKINPDEVWTTKRNLNHKIHRSSRYSHRRKNVCYRLCDPDYKISFKIFWFLSTSLCVGLCFYQVGVRVEYYLQEPGTIQLEMKRILEVKYPSIVLCSSAMTNAFKLFSQEWKKCENGENECSEFVKKMLKMFEDVEEKEEEIVRSLSMIRYTNMKYGVHCPIFDPTTNSCSGFPVADKMNISYIDTIWGSCLVLTLKSAMEYRGPFTWISLEWNNDNISWTGTNEIGSFYFFLHSNESSISRHDAIYLTESLTFGYETTVRITVREFYFRNTKKKSCTNVNNALNCLDTCVDNILNKTLNCRVPFLEFTNLNNCKTGKDLIKAYADADLVYTRLNSKDCTCNARCHKMIYKVSIDGKKALTSNNTRLKLLYSDDTHEVLTEKSIFALSELISEIGGTIGLYLGVCLITIFEVMETLLQQFLTKFK